MHKTISTKVQGKTSCETTTQQCQSNFWFSTFYVAFGFLTHKNEKIDQKQQWKQFVWKNAKTNKKISNHIINKQTTKQSHKA